MTATETITPHDITQERSITGPVPGPKSLELHERRKKVISSGVTATYPIYIDRAHGAIVVDVDGNQYIDLGSGIGVTTVGHTNDGVVAASQEQVAKLTHTLFTITGYESYVRVGELLAELTKGDYEKKLMLVNSGSEAVENAVKIARRYTGKPAVAVLDNAYHGRTILTAAMNHKRAPYAVGIGPLAAEVHHVPSSYPYRDGLSGEEAAKRTIAHIEKRINAEELGILVFEPIQGEGGFMVPAPGFLETLQAWCRENNVVFAADEVQSGIGRTGRFFASEHFDIEPDLIMFAKGIAGGLPLAGVIGRAEILDATVPGGLGGTFGGNPVACAAAISVLEQFRNDGLLAEAERIGRGLTRRLEAMKERFDVIGEVRGRGAMIAIEFVEPGTAETTKVPNADAVAKVTKHALEHGVLALSAGTNGNVVRFLPPLALTDELLDDAMDVIEEAIAGL